MAKPEWGSKRICLNCGARFYDMNNSPIVCPSCGTPYDIEVATRVRKTRPSRSAVADEDELALAKKAKKAKDDEEAENLDDEEVGDDVLIEDDAEEAEDIVAEAEDDEEDPALIEDAEELDDGDDVSDVIEGGIESDEESR